MIVRYKVTDRIFIVVQFVLVSVTAVLLNNIICIVHSGLNRLPDFCINGIFIRDREFPCYLETQSDTLR